MVNEPYNPKPSRNMSMVPTRKGRLLNTRRSTSGRSAVNDRQMNRASPSAVVRARIWM